MLFTECTIYSIDGTTDTRQLKLEDVLVFATGSNCPPPLGFEKKVTIEFDSRGQYPTTSTCGLTLSLPTRYDLYEEFKSAMIEGIVSGFGFGQA